jgi:diguanylate cyclase (GGDEF)-like protein/PAS domain S-box-containing protein
MDRNIKRTAVEPSAALAHNLESPWPQGGGRQDQIGQELPGKLRHHEPVARKRPRPVRELGEAERVDLDPKMFQQVLEKLDEGVYVCDDERRILFWNKGAEQLTGYSAEEVIGSHCFDELLLHVDEEGTNLCRDGCPLSETMRSGQDQQRLVYLHHKQGHRVPVRVRTTPLRDADGAISGAVEIFSSRSYQKDMLERISRLEREALVDPLTHLVNRRHLEASLDTRLAEQQRYGWRFGVLFIDIDHFKQVNDRHGHEVGDLLLRLVALTLSNSIRPFDLVGRWGGEEFVAIVTNVTPQQLEHIAERARILVAESDILQDGQRLSVTISTGATMARSDDTVDTLIRRADRLMYASKTAGRNRTTTDQQTTPGHEKKATDTQWTDSHGRNPPERSD